MQFTYPDEVALPRGVEDEDKLRDLIASYRIEEIDRRLQTAILKGDKDMISWLRSRKQQILSSRIRGNVSIAGNLYTNKVYIPVEEFPEHNFVGLIIGPKGSTQKQLERITRARIYIRGSYKDNYVEPLHCYITAETQENLQRATAVIENLIEDFIFCGDGSRLKMVQLQAIRRSRNKSAALTDWDKFYHWWYFHNKVRKK